MKSSIPTAATNSALRRFEHGRKTGFGIWDRAEQMWLVPLGTTVPRALQEQLELFAEAA